MGKLKRIIIIIIGVMVSNKIIEYIIGRTKA